MSRRPTSSTPRGPRAPRPDRPVRTKRCGPTHTGRVVDRRGPLMQVRTPEGDQVGCVGSGEGKRAVVGDAVEWIADGTLDLGDGRVVAIAPRRSALVRSDAMGRREQVLAANLDQVAIVVAVSPPLRLGLIDRYLVATDAQGLRPLIILNKADLLVSREAQEVVAELLQIYVDLGIPVAHASAVSGAGIEALRGHLRGQTSIFVGHSGVGKSSLLNALQPGLGVPIGDLSEASGRGTHTTTTSTLHVLSDGGEVIDSPGIRSFGLWAMPVEAVKDHFQEFVPLAAGCRFRDCQHLDEPECAVLAALDEGEIAESRYDSYQKIRDSLSDPGGEQRFW